MKTLHTLILVLLASTAYGQTVSNWIQDERTGCKVFNPAPEPKESVQITGNCVNGYLEGQGVVIWNLNGKFNQKTEGLHLKGKLDGLCTVNYLSGDKYEGEFKDGFRNGQATYTAANGSKYVGEYKDSKINGRGIIYSANGSIKQSGIFKDDKLVTSQYIDPNSFTRIARNNSAPAVSDSQRQNAEQSNTQSNLPACQKNGRGTWSNCFGSSTYVNGNKYVGEFKDGERHGQGIFYHLADDQFKGDKYVGEFKDSIRNGQGTYTFAYGTKYVGEWKDDKYHGQGTFTWADGEKYMGEFKDDKFDGQGITYSANGGIKKSGIYKDGNLVTSQYIDPNSFTRIARNNSVPAVTGAQSKRTFTLEEAYGMPASPAAIPKNQNNLPACVGTEIALWSNCFASYTTSNGDKYEYETKNGKINGQGAISWATGDNYVGQFKDNYFDGQGTFTWANGTKYVGEWKNSKWNGKGIHTKPDGYRFEGIFEDNRFIREAKVNLPSLNTNTADNTERNNLELERQRLAEERRRLDEDKRQREQAKQSSRISITASATQPDSSGVVTINIQTNTDTSSLKINDEELGGKPDGSYSVKRVARVGQETKFTIAGVDVNGNTDTKIITVSRVVVESKVTYLQLNPERIKRQPERDAVAVIIGISNYKSLPKADFAKDDAQVFYDYAIRALGVRPGNIKLLMDEQADADEIYAAFKTWLPARVKSTTDVYVFYSGHGLPTQDGSGLYWLPQRANRDVISKTAILLQDINSDIQASKPKSVTIFMDACYSGQARGGETLVASARPIALKSQPSTFPSNFTVISASQADQISSSSPELQHGIFSYYLMRGMEGEADLNKDGKITLDEIQKYLSENVGRQARIMNRQQEPQVIGDGSRVLVGR